MYLINKAGLPEEIRKQIVGGDASTVGDFYNQRDVYGITSDLLVYYCENGISTILGLSEEDLQKDDPLEELYSSESELAKFVNDGTKGLTNQDLKKITNLVIEKSEDLVLLKEFKNLFNLNKVEFKNIANIENLDGIGGAENLSEVRFEKCSVNNYSDLAKNKKLNKLYLIAPVGKNQDVENLCDETVGIGGVDFDNLNYFAVTAMPAFIESTKFHDISPIGSYSSTARFNITSLDSFSKLSKKTRENIKYLYIYNLSINSLENVLTGFSNLLVLRCEYNSLISLRGIENCKKLQYLFANMQKEEFGGSEVTTGYQDNDALAQIEEITELEYVDLSGNSSFKWIKYLKGLEKLTYLNLSNCTSILDLNQIASLVNMLGENCVYPGNLAGSLLANDSKVLNLSNTTIFADDFKKLENSKTLYALKLNNTEIKNDDGSEIDVQTYNNLISEVLSTCTNMNYLEISHLEKLNNISFVKNMKKLYELNLIEDNNLTDLSVLEEMANDNILKLEVLMLSNPNIELTRIQKAISIISDNAWKRRVDKVVDEEKEGLGGCSFWYGSTANPQEADDLDGVILTNENLIKKITQCEELECFFLVPGWRNLFGKRFTGELDLSNCSKLTKLYFGKHTYKIILPQNIEKIGLDNTPVDFSACTKIKWLQLYYLGGSVGFDNIFSTWNVNNNSLEELHILEQSTLKGEKNLDFLKHFENCKNFKTLEISQNGSWTSFVFDDINGLQYVKSLESLELLFGSNSSGCLTNFPDLSELTKLKNLQIKYGNMNLDNIKTCKSLTDLTINNNYIKNVDFLMGINSLINVDLSNNSIGDIEGLRGKTQIKSLKLGYNSIVDIAPLSDLSNVTHLELNNNKLSDFAYDINGNSYYTQAILTDLNQKNNLKDLYLWGNLFDDYSIIKNKDLKWNNLILDENDKPEE